MSIATCSDEAFAISPIILQSLATLAPVKELTPCPESIRRSLHLIENDPSAIPGIRVTLRNKNGKELFEILLGKGHFVRPEPGSMPSSAPEGRYVKVGDRVYLIPVVFENCHPVPAAWVEPLRMYELRKALRMTVWQIDSGKRSLLWTCVRKSTAHPFMLGFPVGQKADNRILSGIAEKLSKPFSMDMAVDVNRLNPSLQLQIHCADGFTYRLDIADGGKTADFDHASLHVSFKRENVVSIPGETPQRKEQRYAVLEKRFAFESGYYNGRIFMIRKDIASALRILPVQQSDK